MGEVGKRGRAKKEEDEKTTKIDMKRKGERVIEGERRTVYRRYKSRVVQAPLHSLFDYLYIRGGRVVWLPPPQTPCFGASTWERGK